MSITQSFPRFKSSQTTITQPPQNNVETSNPNGNVKAKLFYINDIHCQMSKMMNLKGASDTFDKSVKNNPNVDALKTSAGDCLIGENKQKNNLWIAFQNLINIDLSAIGNHELDNSSDTLAKEAKQANYKYVASNVNTIPNSTFGRAMQDNTIVKSTIIEKNGNKYGFIGAAPIDFKKHISPKANVEGFEVQDFEQTKKSLQNEIDELKKKGINKIFLLSHMGYDVDVKMAQSIDGIDVIQGGHTHKVKQGLIRGKNLVKSPNGDPVIILQAGKDGKFFGILDVEFDSKGIIKSANNNVIKSEKAPKDISIIDLVDKHLGNAQSLGILADVTLPKDNEKEENPLANMVTDSMREKAGCQIAFVNGASVRGNLHPGIVTNRDIQQIVTFQNEVKKVNLSEKDIVDALKVAAKGDLLQVSGLKYTVTPQKTLKEVLITNNDGTITKLNIDKPSSDKKFTAVYDNFLLTGGHNYESLKKPKNEVVETYKWIQEDAVIEHINSKNYMPINLKQEGRIVIES